MEVAPLFGNNCVNTSNTQQLCLLSLVLVVLFPLAAPCPAQFEPNESHFVNFARKSSAPNQSLDKETVDGSSSRISDSELIRNRWQVGVRIKGGARTARNFLVTIPIPTDWPEQQVDLHEEQIPNEVDKVTYRSLNSGVQQMVITIPKISANQLIELTATYNVATSRIHSPENTEGLKIPKRVKKPVKEHLGVSPQISYRNAKLRNKVKEIIADKNSAWSQTEAIYEWVRENIEYHNDEPSDTLSVFRSGTGCPEDLVKLFVAMCRAVKIPARVVWSETSQYAEFYLQDETGEGHWFPCNVSGRRDFGRLSDPRVILQKGDNIKVPEKEHRQKFCAEFVTGQGKVKPQVQFIRKRLPAK